MAGAPAGCELLNVENALRFRLDRPTGGQRFLTGGLADIHADILLDESEQQIVLEPCIVESDRAACHYPRHEPTAEPRVRRIVRSS